MGNNVDVDSTVSSHTRHMRRAVKEMCEEMEKLRTKATRDNNPKSHRLHESTVRSAWLASKQNQKDRGAALQSVRKRLRSGSACLPIDSVYMKEDDTSWTVVRDEAKGVETAEWKDVCAFKRQYCAGNVPCIIIDGLHSNFGDISAQWRSNIHHRQVDHKKYDNDGIERGSDDDTTKINTEWFRRFVGDDTLVPVRIDKLGVSNDDNSRQHGLDADGRAEECETKQMELTEWIRQCQIQSKPAEENSSSETQVEYLKDWHLVQHLFEKHRGHSHEPSPALPLYTTPTFFERDILNKFLEKYGEGADYKFVYWGPSGSQTRLHSDVLHSFSWSYNVVGKKKWIFHLPFEKGQDEMCFEVIQETGQTIFVPSGWKHEVVNLVETLSINHNWVTSANIDKMWDCLLTEMASIEEEVKEWESIPKDDYEVKENMLKGCVGFNVTMFTIMTLFEVIEMLLIICDEDNTHKQESRIWDCAYSVFRLEAILDDLMSESTTTLRLQAILGSQMYAHDVQYCANEAIECVSNIFIKSDLKTYYPKSI
ncbi:hypothetical protein ACHAWF_005269 [Thalassiosira exigua]